MLVGAVRQILRFSTSLVLEKVHVEVLSLAIWDIVETYVIMDGLIKQLVRLLESCLLHRVNGNKRVAAKDMAGLQEL